MEKILVNKIRCKRCGDVIESTAQHQFVVCKCGAVAIDGGHYHLSRFICLSCLHTDTVAINGIQRGSSQREYGHIKNSVCVKCGDVKTIEVRENDYFPDIMEMAVEKHNELYNDNVKIENLY